MGVEGSPSSGVSITSSDPRRAGRPEWPEGSDELVLGEGIYIEELRKELTGRGISDIRCVGITHQLPDHDQRAERVRLERIFTP